MNAEDDLSVDLEEDQSMNAEERCECAYFIICWKTPLYLARLIFIMPGLIFEQFNNNDILRNLIIEGMDNTMQR